MLKEACASCLQPVYSMERVVADKVCVHRSCFCCQLCRRKLSLQNYSALHGVFYCQAHYKQMAGAKSSSERERLEQRLGDHHIQQVAMVGRGPQPQGWYNTAKKKTEAREKPTSFHAECGLRLAEPRQELNSRPVLLGNQLRKGWPPSETALLAVDGKAGKGACSWKNPALSLPAYQAASSRAGRLMFRGQEGKSVVGTAVEKGSFLPGVTSTKGREQVCSWPRTREQRDVEKIEDGDMPQGKRGGKVSQQVAAIQQSKAPLRRRPVSSSSPLVLEPVKSLPHGSLVHHATRQSTKATKWMYLGDAGGCILSGKQANKVWGSLSTAGKGGTMPAVTEDEPELTIATPATAGDKHHLRERMNSPQPIRVPQEPETRTTTSIEQKCGSEAVDPTENEAEEARCFSGVSRTPYVSSVSLEPEEMSLSPEITEVVNEKSKANTNEFTGRQIPVNSGENTQPSSISHLPGTESKGAEFEKAKEVKPQSTSGFLEEPSPEHVSRENKAENGRVSSPGLPDKTDDHSVSCLQETEPQGTCGPMVTSPHEDLFRHDIKSPGEDLPVSADTPLKGTCATCPSRDEFNNSESKDHREALSGNIFHISEQPGKTSSTPNVSLDKSTSHPEGEEKMDMKLPGESTVHTSRPGAQNKETRSSQACREMLGKGFRLGKNPFTTLFGSEDKGSTPKKETTTHRKPTKPQSALVTLFGHSPEKKQSQREKPARSSEQTNIDNRPEKPQDLLCSSSQAKQNSSKNDQLPQLGKREVFPKHNQESSGGFCDSTEGKETDVLLLAPGTSISCTDKCERTELNISGQLPLNSQVQQQQDGYWLSLMAAKENQKEAAASSAGGTNFLYPPPELVPEARNSKNLIMEGKHRDAPLLEIQNLLSLDVQDTVTEDGLFFSPGNSEKLPKEAELQLDNLVFLEDNNLLFSGGQDFPSVASKSPNSDLQNSEAKTPPYLEPNTSELCQEIPAETNAPLVLWDTSSLSLSDGQDDIDIRDVEVIQSWSVLQQLGPQCQAPKTVEDRLELGLGAESSTNKPLSTQEDNFPPVHTFTSHASETFTQGGFGLFDVDSTTVGQEASEKNSRSRTTSGDEDNCGSLSSPDLSVSNDGLSDQEFFI